MNYSNLRATRYLATLLCAVSLFITRNVSADEMFTPRELESLRQVSRAVLETRASERKRVLHATADQRRVLADVDTRLRALEAAVMDDRLPRILVTPNAAMGMPATQVGTKAPPRGAAGSRLASRAPLSANNRLPPPSDVTSTAQDAAGNSSATLSLIDQALATVSVHRRALSSRETSTAAGALPQLARMMAPGSTSATAPDPSTQRHVADALDVVEAELRHMRVQGADLQALHRARARISITVPTIPREIAPTIQTITRHY